MLIFTVTEEQANIILAGLGELPAKISFPLIQELQKQAQSQIGEKNEGTKENKS